MNYHIIISSWQNSVHAKSQTIGTTWKSSMWKSSWLPLPHSVTEGDGEAGNQEASCRWSAGPKEAHPGSKHREAPGRSCTGRRKRGFSLPLRPHTPSWATRLFPVLSPPLPFSVVHRETIILGQGICGTKVKRQELSWEPAYSYDMIQSVQKQTLQHSVSHQQVRAAQTPGMWQFLNAVWWLGTLIASTDSPAENQSKSWPGPARAQHSTKAESQRVRPSGILNQVFSRRRNFCWYEPKAALSIKDY